MRRLYPDWVVCPICHAGSPSGVATCPRCRYVFQLKAASEAGEFHPNPAPRREPTAHHRRLQVTLAPVMVSIAALGCILAWPELLAPAVIGAVALGAASLCRTLDRLLTWLVVLMALLVFAVPRFVPPIRTSCVLRIPATSAAILASGDEADQPAPPAHESYSERVPGSAVRFEMIAIPGGTFKRGSPAGERGRGDDEGPRHPVAIRPFWMGKTEVTWDEYDVFRKGGFVSNKTNAEALARDADAVTRPTPPYIDETRGYGREGYPAIGVSHHAAMEYCHWLSKQTGKTYRLPTEAEWEYACRAGTDTAYSFGDTPAQLARYAWFADNAGDTTHPVGRKAANAWGLHDIAGNAAEWCVDRYRKDAYAALPLDRPTFNPVSLPAADPYPHVARGGSWADRPEACRSAARRGSDPSWNRIDPDGSIWWVWDADFVGFRVVRPVEEQDDLKGLRSQVRRRER